MQTIFMKVIKIIVNPSIENLNNLNAILNFMYDDNVTIVSMKVPEFYQINIMLGFEVALQYRITGAVKPNLKESIQIDNNWYYVLFK